MAFVYDNQIAKSVANSEEETNLEIKIQIGKDQGI